MRHRHRTGARSLFTIEFSSSDSSDTDDSHVVHPGETCAKGRNLIEFSSSDASVTDDEVAVSRTSPVKPTPPPEEEPEETVTLTESGDAFDGATNDNPLFAHDLSTQDIFGNQFEEQSNFLTS